MKKLYLLLPLLLLATSCDETSSESSSVSVSDSSEVVDNGESSMQALIEQELNVIKNSPGPTSIRDNFEVFFAILSALSSATKSLTLTAFS